MKVSILTTAYNYPKYIRHAIQSVADQDYKDEIEMVVVDDCSSDKTWANILEYAQRFPFVKPIRNAERSYCGSSNAVALAAATGDICCILDGDDLLKPESVSTIVDLYNRHPHLGYIWTNHDRVKKDLTSPKRGCSCMPFSGMSMLQTYQKRGLNCFSHWRTFRTGLRDKGVLFRPGLKFAVDKYLGFVLEELAPGGFCPKSLYLYRFHKTNMTSTEKLQKPTALVLAAEFAQRRKHEGIKAKEINQIV